MNLGYRVKKPTRGENMEDSKNIEAKLDEWRREDLQDRRREALWNAIVNMIVALAALIVAIRA